MTASALRRWYGGQPLVTSVGTRLEFEKIVADEWTIVASLLGRRNDYAGRNDVDGWDVEARLSANRPLGLTTLGFANLSIERSAATDPGQAHWRGRVGMGMVKEVGWGLRQQIRVDLARQVNDDPLAPFGKKRRDWLLEGSFSIYKRDWNLEGFAPSLSLTATRNHSTLPLYDQRRLRGELRLTKAF